MEGSLNPKNSNWTIDLPTDIFQTFHFQEKLAGSLNLSLNISNSNNYLFPWVNLVIVLNCFIGGRAKSQENARRKNATPPTCF